MFTSRILVTSRALKVSLQTTSKHKQMQELESFRGTSMKTSRATEEAPEVGGGTARS